MANRRRFSGRGGAGPGFQWTRAIDVQNAITTKTLVISLTGQNLDLTIRRNLIDCFIVSDQQAATESFGGVIGVTIVTDVARAVGASALPGPVTNPDADWLLYGAYYGRLLFSNSAVRGQDPGSHHYDSKAMRKLNQDESVVFMVEPYSGSPGIVLDMVWSELLSLRGNS